MILRVVFAAWVAVMAGIVVASGSDSHQVRWAALAVAGALLTCWLVVLVVDLLPV